MKICLYEDEEVLNLSPLNLLRHTSELICGAFSNKERVESFLPVKYKTFLLTRKYLNSYILEKFNLHHFQFHSEENILFLNSRILFDDKSLNKLQKYSRDHQDFLLLDDNEIIGFLISREKLESLLSEVNNANDSIITRDLIYSFFKDKSQIQISKFKINNLKKIVHNSDLILHFKEQLNKDFSDLITNQKKLNRFYNKSKFKKKNKTFISMKSHISDNVVFDSSNGAVIIEEGVTIEPFVFIKGPAIIKENSLIKANTSIYGPVYIGKRCKISGEISHSIIHSFVNKQHHGFLGHSYLCEWINLGAGTTTSNLKNNYSNIRITSNNSEVDTGTIFLGSLIGDHTKTGINTMLNTGSVIGIFSNLIGSGYHKKNIPSFSWVNSDNNTNVRFNIDKAVDSANKSMLRRGVSPSDNYISLIRYLYNN